MHRASCLCGAVRITVEGDLPPPSACHCSICRKISGHVEASTDVPKDRVRIEGESALTWHASSEKVRRGFCSICGSSLLFDPPHRDWIAISMGAFDGPTGTRLAGHIFTDDKGDYYEIADGLPQNPQ
ncbi:MAG: GFA family protein [Pseudomonadota bacterium]